MSYLACQPSAQGRVVGRLTGVWRVQVLALYVEERVPGASHRGQKEGQCDAR